MSNIKSSVTFNNSKELTTFYYLSTSVSTGTECNVRIVLNNSTEGDRVRSIQGVNKNSLFRFKSVEEAITWLRKQGNE